MKPNYKSISYEDLSVDLDRRLDEATCREVLAKVSEKTNGLSNIATFADFKKVRLMTHVRSDISKEYLSVSTELCEFPGNKLSNDGTSKKPLNFDYSYLYPIEDTVPPPMPLVTDTDISDEFLPSHSGYLYGTVKTFNCDPKMKCPSCNGSKKCVQCYGHGEVRCDNCNGTGECWKCHGRGRLECIDCGGHGYFSNGVRCGICDGKGYKDCYICGGSGKCDECHGAKYLRCSACHGTGVCPRCKGEGIVTCTRCKGTGYYQTIMSFRTDRYARRLHYPPLESEMSNIVRTAVGDPSAGFVLRQWKNWRTIQPDRNNSIMDIGTTDEDVMAQIEPIRQQFLENDICLEKLSDEDIPYRETWSSETIPDKVIEYSICGENYSLHIVGLDRIIAYSEFPDRLTIFDENGQAVKYKSGGQARKIALSKLAAYLFRADGMDIAETRMMTRICQCMGYSNRERWRLMSHLEKYGPEMPFDELKKEIAPVLQSKKTLCFAWHCIAVDNVVTEKERTVFDWLVQEFGLDDQELVALKAFTETKFAKLPDDQIVREYIDSKPRSVSIRKVVWMVLSGIALVVAALCQFAFETDDSFTLYLLPSSYTMLLLNIPFKRQREYSQTKPLLEPRPIWLYLLLLGGFIFFFWWKSYNY